MEKNINDIALSFSKLNEDELLNNLFLNSLQGKFPVAVWKLPGTDEKNIVIEFTDKLIPKKINLDQETRGFALSPFINTENKNTLLIQPDLYYNFKTKKLNIDNSFEKEQTISSFLNNSLSKEQTASNSLFNHLQKIHFRPSNKDHYVDIVKNAITTIKNNEIKKVVLARQKEVKLNNTFNPINAFNTLCKEQLNSFVSLIFIPEHGMWIGASPELLVSINKENIFKTTALAGTQNLNHSENLSDVVWTQKEIEEQALVNRYIVNCFKTIRLREFEEDGPRTVKAGNLFHLKTDFTVNINEVNFPDLGSVMLDLLHPTSAVCGMPKDKSLEFIHAQEGINRKFYSGFLGPVNLDNESHIFVNIRCAEIGNEQAMVYSGAGITADSNPEKEYEETELKMKTIIETIMTYGFEL